MTQTSELFALIKYLRENDHKVVSVKLLADNKKFLPMWLKCNSKNEYDQYFNPIIVNEEDGRKRQADLIEISAHSYTLRSKAGKLNIETKNCEVPSEEPFKSRTVTRAASRNKELSKRKSDELSNHISNDITIGNIPNDSRNDKEKSTRSSKKKRPNSSDEDDSGIKRSFTTSTPVKSTHELPGINTSMESIPMIENKIDQGKVEIIKITELDTPIIENLTKIYSEIENLKQQIQELESVQPAVDTSNKILIAGKYPIEKARVSYGLAKTTIEKYFRELIAHGWKSEEKANHNLTGSGARGNRKIDSKKMDAFIDYCLNSWNEFHSKNNPGTSGIVPHHLIDEKRKALKSLMGLICQEETKRARKSSN